MVGVGGRYIYYVCIYMYTYVKAVWGRYDVVSGPLLYSLFLGLVVTHFKDLKARL